jgi:hypothetical protein
MMFKATLNCCTFPFLNKKQLINLKIKAMRSGAWFKVLQRIDRVLFDLTIIVVDNIRSIQLAKSMLMLTRKLQNAMRGSFSIRLQEIGLPLAQKISSTAQKLGNLSAIGWVFDSSFTSFLAVMHINNVKNIQAIV